MQLSDYALAIGNRLCLIIGQVNTLQTAVTLINNRVTVLENKPVPVFVMPKFTPTAVLPPIETDIVTILQALEQQFGILRSATGDSDLIYQTLTKQCVALNTSKALGSVDCSMGSIVGWSNNPSTLANTINNMWLTMCDVRAAVGNLKLNYSSKGCDGITIGLQLTLTGTILKLYFTGNIPSGFQSCAPAGTMFTITDTSGGLVNMFVDVITGMNDVNGVPLNLSTSPLNLLNDLIVIGTPCFYNNNSNATCQSALQETFYNTLVCPELLLSPLFTSIIYTTTTISGPAEYTIQVWNATGSRLITSVTTKETGPGLLSGSIEGLTEGTSYKVRLIVNVGNVSTNCSFYGITTSIMPVVPAP